MSTSTTIYKGNLSTENTHVQSGTVIYTDAPIDNHGKGESFSPTDLVATALCDCIFTIMGINAQNQGFSIDGATAKTTKIMATQAPRRIAEIHIEYDFTKCILTDKQKEILQRIPKVCPVSLSLHPDILQDVTFRF